MPFERSTPVVKQVTFNTARKGQTCTRLRRSALLMETAESDQLLYDTNGGMDPLLGVSVFFGMPINRHPLEDVKESIS